MTTHTLSFSIHGEHLTRQARDFVIEGDYPRAHELLYEGLVGISTDQVNGILRGDYKLEGVNDVFMVEDDKSFFSKIEEMFGGVWRVGDRYMRPYAIVTSWGCDDMFNKNRITKDSDDFLMRSGKSESISGAHRSLYYANDIYNDVLKLLKINDDRYAKDRNGNVHILFKEIRNFPFQLIPAHRSAQDALDAYQKTNSLRQVGYKYSFPESVYRVRHDADFPDSPSPLVRSRMSDDEDNEAAIKVIGDHRLIEHFAKKNDVPFDVAEAYQKQSLSNGAFQNYFDKIEETREKERSTSLSIIRKEVIKQAGDNWIEHTLTNGTKLRIPRAPFEHWLFHKTSAGHLALPWKTVSYSGMKMMNDDPYHTDWMLGAGLDLYAMDDRQFSDEIYELRFRLLDELTNFQCDILSGGGTVRGRVVHPKIGDEISPDDIIVIKSATPEYVELAMKAKAVITERGGSMAHLVNVGREANVLIVRKKDARKLYPEGINIAIFGDRGEIDIAH